MVVCGHYEGKDAWSAWCWAELGSILGVQGGSVPVRKGLPMNETWVQVHRLALVLFCRRLYILGNFTHTYTHTHVRARATNRLGLLQKRCISRIFSSNKNYYKIK